MPTAISTVGFSLTQAPPFNRPCRSRFTEAIQKKLKRLMKDSSIGTWAEDEVHFQQHGSRCRMWIAPETTDPVVLHQPTRKSAGYFGAVRLRDGKFVSPRRSQVQRRNLSRFSQATQAKCVSFRTAGRGTTGQRHYRHGKLHKEWRTLHCKQFKLDYLPPYSPELNSIERVWKLTRRKCLHNVHFEQLSQLTNR